MGGQRAFSPEENSRQIRLTRELGAVGTVLWSFGSAQRKGLPQHLKETLYRSKVPVPKMARLTDPAAGVVLGTVKRADGTPAVDAWVSIAPAGRPTRKAAVFSQVWTTSADGRFAFLKVPPGQVLVTVSSGDASAVKVGPIEIERGKVARCEATVGGEAATREAPAVDGAIQVEQIVSTEEEATSSSAAVFLAIAAENTDEPDSDSPPHTLEEALESLDGRDDWTDLPKLNTPVHPAEKYLKGITIVLDPGHGGGRTQADGNREADMNFRVAKLLEKLLVNAEVNVIMTRDGDHDLSLKDRAAVANNAQRSDGGKGADLLISIHHNAGGKSANYSTVWFHGEVDWSEPGLDVARYVGHALGEALRTDVGLTSPVMSDQQMYPAGFGVLRHCQVPAILLECSFFSNPKEKRRLADAFYNLREAYAVYRGLCQYAYGGRPTSEPPTASLEDGVLRVEAVLDDGLPADWWGGDRNRILTSTICVSTGDRRMNVGYDPAGKKLTATLDPFDEEDLKSNVLEVHFANFFKHHNWPQRFALPAKISAEAADCSTLPARRWSEDDE